MMELNDRQPTYNELDDSTLWKTFQQGDRAAYGQMYQKYVRLLLIYGLKIWQNEEAVRDEVQDLFIELWKSRERLQSTDNIKIYLFQALRYKLIRQKTKQEATLIDLSAVPNTDFLREHSHESFLIDEENKNENSQKLQKVMQDLPPRQQEVLHLRFYQGCSNEEIAQIMDIKYQSVSNLMYKSLEFLKKHLLEVLLWWVGMGWV